MAKGSIFTSKHAGMRYVEAKRDHTLKGGCLTRRRPSHSSASLLYVSSGSDCRTYYTSCWTRRWRNTASVGIPCFAFFHALLGCRGQPVLNKITKAVSFIARPCPPLSLFSPSGLADTRGALFSRYIDEFSVGGAVEEDIIDSGLYCLHWNL